MKVTKFGGSSLANAFQIQKVCNILLADEDRRIMVVSAPGKRTKDDTKVTDLLIAVAKARIAGESYDKETFNEIVKYIMRQPRSMRKVEMIELQQRAVSFAHDCEGCGRRDKPTIKEYVQGKR